MESIKDVLFRNAARAWEEWTTSQNCSAIPTVRKQIYKHRCAALIQVIQEAGIADEYEKWREKNNEACGSEDAAGAAGEGTDV